MANTRKSTKRAAQADKRYARNQIVRSATKTAIRTAVEAIQATDLSKAKATYEAAIVALSKAASKGTIPKARAARKISRLAKFLKKTHPTLAKSQ
jgi:small subunit ribosomal protein S20